MPRFDSTGPLGYGPMTGRGMGPCVRGRRGLGWRRLTRKEEADSLREEAEDLKSELEAVKERLSEIEGEK